MQDFEKIKLGFDEAYLEEQLSKVSKNFDEFASGVRQKIDKDVFSEDALRRMYVASERLKAVTEELHKVEQLKSQANTNDEIYMKRLEAQKQHLTAMQSREVTDLERVRRGLPSGGSQPQQPGTFGAAAQGVGMGILGSTGSAMDAALGVHVSGTIGAAGNVYKAYKGKVDPETGERVRDPEEVGAAWGSLIQKIGEITIGQAFKGYEMIRQQDTERIKQYQSSYLVSGGGAGDEMADSEILDRFGMSRLEYLRLGAKTTRTAGTRGFNAMPDIAQIGRTYGGEAGDALTRLIEAMEKGGFAGGGELGYKAIGLAISEGLDKSRLPELLHAMQRSVEGSLGKRDVNEMLQHAEAITMAGGEPYRGAKAFAVMDQFSQAAGGGRGRGMAMSILMGQMGKDFHSASMAVEESGTFSSPAFMAAMRDMLQGVPDDMKAHIVANTTGMKLHDAEVYVKALYGGATGEAFEATGRGVVGDAVKGIKKFEELHTAGKHLDRPALLAGETVAAGVRAGDDMIAIGKRLAAEGTRAVINKVREGFFNGPRNETVDKVMNEALGTGEAALEKFGDLAGATFSNPDMVSALSAASGAFGQKWKLGGNLSGDRSREQQEAIWTRKLAEMADRMKSTITDPNVIAATRRIAAAGHSQHEEGNAIDLPPSLAKFLTQNDPTGEKFGLKHPDRLGADDPNHFELTSQAKNLTKKRLQVTTIVEPVAGSADAAKEHQEQQNQRYESSRDLLGERGAGAPTAGR